jgi:hypothetical protein
MRSQLVTIYWRDIPAQVNAQAGRTRHQVLLHKRFQRAIDQAAMVAGLTNAHDYTKEWRREARPCGDDLEAEATAEAARLEEAYPKERLQALAELGGAEGGAETGGSDGDDAGVADAPAS